MGRVVCVAFALVGMAAAGEAAGADKLVIGAPPAWVKPTPLPPAADKPDEAAVKLLLQDEQYDLQPGRQTRYSESVYRIQTPQGLAAGAVSLAWNPEHQVASVHKLQIRRGATIIDVLASGQTFTVVRRESNLENAVIDGVLTATMQPEGLQVGDIVDFATSVSNSDPALGTHIEQIGAAWSGFPVAHARFRAQWPVAAPLHIRTAGGLVAPKPVKAAGLNSVTIALDDVQPRLPPKGAPLRYAYGRVLEMSDFTSWSGVAALMVPLYTKAATLGPKSPLAAEVARIRAASPDPQQRALAVLALVQDRVRYVFVGLNEGGLVPADADTTWARRFGDCKGKTALLIALLHALDITAEPVLVNTQIGDGLDERLPMVGLFNHVLVRATIGGKTYWLDGTRTGDRGLDALIVPGFRWGLPVVPGSAALVPLLPPPLAEPQMATTIRIDASAGITLPAPAHVEQAMRGDIAIGTNLQLANMTADVRDRTLRDYWKGRYDFITAKTTATAFDPVARTLTLTLDGDAKLAWPDGFYEADGVSVGYKADFARQPGADGDAPFAVPYPVYGKTRETILLPPQGGRFRLYKAPADVDRTIAGVAYRRHAEIVGNRFTVEESERSVMPEFPATEAPAAEAALRALAEQHIYLQRPDHYRPTDQEVAAMMTGAPPKTASGLVERGNLLLDRGRFAEASAEFTAVAALDPKNVWALADRALAELGLNDRAAAKRDLDAAAAIDARNAVVYRGRGALALLANAYPDAISAFTTALEIEPGNLAALFNRARAYRANRQPKLALADYAEAIRLSPTTIDFYLERASILKAQGAREEGLRDAVALRQADPGGEDAAIAAAKIYDAFGATADAIRSADDAIRIRPASYLYLNRALVRAKTDLAGRTADIDMALKLEPKSAEALRARAQLQHEKGDEAGAAATLSAALTIAPDDPGLLNERGLAYARAGQAAAATRDFTAARAKTVAAAQLNSLCWAKATAGVALADCDAALAKAPAEPNVLDSRGLVLLRLGRIDEAIAAYDRAIAGAPSSASSLYGRGIAEARRGDTAKADRDIAAALKVDAAIARSYADYGVTPDQAGRGAAAAK